MMRKVLFTVAGALVIGAVLAEDASAGIFRRSKCRCCCVVSSSVVSVCGPAQLTPPEKPNLPKVPDPLPQVKPFAEK